MTEAPEANDWAWLDAIVGQLDADAALAALEDMPEQARPGLDELFR